MEPELAAAYSKAPDYPEYAKASLKEMIRQTGNIQINKETGMIQKGVIVRHLVLPGHRKESMQILDWLADALPKADFLLSLMGQYTPPDEPLSDKHLNRRIATFEYESVRKYAVQLGLDGYGQERSSASSLYTPEFWTE